MEYERITKRDEIQGRAYTDECFGCESHCDTCPINDSVWERLAELEDKIEQGTLKEEKTCTNITEIHPVDEFTCSGCGFSLVDFAEQRVDEEYNTTYHEYEIKYCPNCGAKVLQNG